MVQQSGYDPHWATVDANEVPQIKVEAAGTQVAGDSAAV